MRGSVSFLCVFCWLVVLKAFFLVMMLFAAIAKRAGDDHLAANRLEVYNLHRKFQLAPTVPLCRVISISCPAGLPKPSLAEGGTGGQRQQHYTANCTGPEATRTTSCT